jgi:hypothetical protein
MCPALYLYPLNESFIPKHISLLPQQRVKIGRQTNVKTVPAERNGYFDSKVLSSQHAEVWEESGKIFIKDVKSSNGTFINGERLSAEGLESEPFELKTDDIVEFGIDIVGEDNKTIIHHKVAARVVCVFTEQDVQAAARAEQQQQNQNPPGYPLANHHQNPNSAAGPSNAFSFNSNQGAPGPQRRPPMQSQGLIGMGGMGGSMRPPGKSGLTFEHIFNRLQGELQKSRETGSELHSLTGAMGDIHETLGGSMPADLPPYPHNLPPVMLPQPHSSEPSSSAAPPSAIVDLQSQLQETQTSLANQIDKFRVLETILAEHESFKQEVQSLRTVMEERKREMEVHDHRHRDDEYMSDDDDARSVGTVVPHELERVDEEDEEAASEDEERRRTRDELGRPSTPEPTGMGGSDDEEAESKPSVTALSRPSIPEDIVHRLNTLSEQLESALEQSRILQAQHATAQSTISLLESKVSALESLVQTTQSTVQAQGEAQKAALAQVVDAARTPADEPEWDRESITQMVNEWKKNVEGKWSSVQEEWNSERERLKRARDEWENKAKTMEEGIVSKVESTLATFQLQNRQQLLNGNAKFELHGPGLVTPPSPRSLSSDSMRPRSRKKRSASSRGRSKSPSHSIPSNLPVTDDEDEHELLQNGISNSPTSRPRSPSTTDESSDSEAPTESVDSILPVNKAVSIQFPITPEASLVCQPERIGSLDGKTAAERSNIRQLHVAQYSTAVGMLFLSVAAAAVIWRVKPE